MIQNRDAREQKDQNQLCAVLVVLWCCAFSSFSLPENNVVTTVGLLFADATSD